MVVLKEFPEVIKEIMKGDSYTKAVLAFAPEDLRQKVGDSDLVDIVRHMVDRSTPEELVIKYLHTVQEKSEEEFENIVDKMLEEVDNEAGDTHDS